MVGRALDFEKNIKNNYCINYKYLETKIFPITDENTRGMQGNYVEGSWFELIKIVIVFTCLLFNFIMTFIIYLLVISDWTILQYS